MPNEAEISSDDFQDLNFPKFHNSRILISFNREFFFLVSQAKSLIEIVLVENRAAEVVWIISENE
jgi:hypothetical protein